MRSVICAVVVVVVGAQSRDREILRRQGDYFLRQEEMEMGVKVTPFYVIFASWAIGSKFNFLNESPMGDADIPGMLT